MSLDVKQFREYIVRPALQAIGLWSEAAEELVTGTAMVESTLNYVKQLGGGPAVGVCEEEPATYLDNKDRIKNKYPRIYAKVLTVLNMQELPIDASFLMGNLTASVIFCRLKYYLHPDPLPTAHDYVALAAYHKKIYNTSLGHTDISRSTNIFKSVVMGYPYKG